MKTEDKPLHNINGAVLIGTRHPLIRKFIQEQYQYSHTGMSISKTNTGLEGFYLTEELYSQDNKDTVEGVLWVLSDVLENVGLEEFSTQHTHILVGGAGYSQLYEGYYSYSTVTLRVFIIKEELTNA